MEIIPTINTNEMEVAEKNLGLVSEVHDLVKWLHLDVSDGEFSESVTLGLDIVKTFPELTTDFMWEVHLMVVEPIEWVDRCAEVGMDLLMGHVEQMSNQEAFVDAVLRANMEVGLAIDGPSDVNVVNDRMWQWIDKVLVFGGPGVGPNGQEFQDVTLKKIAQIVELRKAGGYAFTIEVDGGVNLDTVGKIHGAGADAVSGNSAIYKDDNVRRNIMDLVERSGV